MKLSVPGGTQKAQIDPSKSYLSFFRTRKKIIAPITEKYEFTN